VISGEADRSISALRSLTIHKVPRGTSASHRRRVSMIRRIKEFSSRSIRLVELVISLPRYSREESDRVRSTCDNARANPRYSGVFGDATQRRVTNRHRSSAFTFAWIFFVRTHRGVRARDRLIAPRISPFGTRGRSLTMFDTPAI